VLRARKNLLGSVGSRTLTWPNPSTTPWSARMWLAVTTSAIAWDRGSSGFLAGAGWAGTVVGASAVRANAAAMGKTRARWVMVASLEAAGGAERMRKPGPRTAGFAGPRPAQAGAGL